ncbi:AI-2E family transporter [Streptomonospora sp. PA3]|nr:AI-2E family transporter [Streptomonospora sp. PA3]MUL43455.1 AI-2E family transporter [Streptomonospora sp. PA3]
MARAERGARRTRGGSLEQVNFFVVGFVGALGVLSAWLLVETLALAQDVFVTFLVALFLAVGLNPVVEFLRRRGLPRWAAITAVCLALVTLAAGFFWTIVPPLTRQVAAFVADLPDYFVLAQQNPVLADLDRRFEVLDRLQGFLTSAEFQRRLFGGVFGIGQAVINSLFAAFITLVLTVFFMVSLPGITEVGYRLVPRSRRAVVRELGDEIIERIGAFIAGQLVIALIGGAVALAYLTVIGSGYALTLSLIVAVTALIPLVGTTIGALAVTLAVGVGDLRLGAVTLAFFLVYQQIESYVIAPRILQRSVHVAPTVIITSALLGGALLGVVGALLAVPVSAAVTLVLNRVVFPRLEER